MQKADKQIFDLPTLSISVYRKQFEIRDYTTIPTYITQYHTL